MAQGAIDRSNCQYIILYLDNKKKYSIRWKCRENVFLENISWRIDSYSPISARFKTVEGGNTCFSFPFYFHYQIILKGD